MKIGIIGLGLIGGSFAIAAKKHVSPSKLFGNDKNLENEKKALELGLIDEVGDEFVARELAAKIVNIDPKIHPLTFGKKKKKILGLIPGSRIVEKIINNIFFEFDSSNKVLWLYKP